MSDDSEKRNSSEAPEAPELTDADMPPIESLRPGADLGAFFSPKVGAELRKRALRAVFRQGRFNIRDGLDDYDEDYTAFPALARAPAELRKLLAERERKRDGKTESEQSPPPDSDSQAARTAQADSESQMKSQTDSETQTNSESELESESKTELESKPESDSRESSS